MVCQLVFKPRICRISCAGKSVHEIAEQFLLKTQADQVGLQDWKVRLWSTLIGSAYHMHNSLMRYCLCSTFARSNGVSAKECERHFLAKFGHNQLDSPTLRTPTSKLVCIWALQD